MPVTSRRDAFESCDKIWALLKKEAERQSCNSASLHLCISLYDHSFEKEDLMRFRHAIFAIIFLSIISLVQAGEDKPPVNRPAAIELKDPSELKALKYRSIGPNWGGRASRAAGVIGHPNIYYAAIAGGGVWKTTDSGTT